jgi:dTMP kinase
MSGGCLIALEGIDGAGKTEQAALLGDWLQAAGHDVVVTCEPGGTAFGAALRDLLRSPVPRSPVAELLAYIADHREHLERVVWPALEAGQTIVTDRWTDSTYVYQGLRSGVGEALVAALLVRAGGWTTQPRLTVLLDLDAATAWQRLQSRGTWQDDRWEHGGTAALARRREAYLACARQDRRRYTIIDAGGEVGQVAAAIREAVRPLLEPSRMSVGEIPTCTPRSPIG